MNSEEKYEKLAEEVVKDYNRIQLKERLQKIDQEYQSRAKSKRIYYWSAASVIIIVGGFLVKTMFFQAPASSQELFAEYFEPYRAIGVNRGEESESMFQQAMVHYITKDFNKTIEVLEKVESPEPVHLFYLGVCYLAVNNPSAAIKPLKNTMMSNSPFSQQATWFLGLAYLRIDDYENARTELSKLTDGKYNHQKATKLLEVMPVM